jgi:2-oxoglutarate dehydrogenase complex dehydrogenase (E1) component-like enzyme
MQQKYKFVIVFQLKYAGRGPLATPAVGIGQMHQKEAELVSTQPFTRR